MKKLSVNGGTKLVGRAWAGWLVMLFAMLGTYTASAGLEQLDAFVGRYSLSVDGGGDLMAPYTIQVHKPNNDATVHRAYVMAAGVPGATIANGDVSINGQPISWATTIFNGGLNFHNAVQDVTSIIKPVVDATQVTTPGGQRITFNFTEVETYGDLIDGCALAVIFNDPHVAPQTIILLFGGLEPTGDRFSITTGEVIPPTGVADMGLGISYGYQPGSQVTIIDVNGQRLTSTAGGHDDRERANVHADGALITVGGLDDSNDNPVNPSTWTPSDGGSAPYSPDPRDDDELYSLIPFITNTSATEVGARATNIQVSTINPSNDDNIFFAYFVLSGVAVLGEGIVVTPSDAVQAVGESHTLTASLVDAVGEPITGRGVRFTVIAGPNQGAESSVLISDGNGQVTWILNDQARTGGTDEVEATFLNSQEQVQASNIATVTWIAEQQPASQSIDLYHGWNLISLSITPHERDPALLFGSESYVYSLKKAGSGFNFTYTYDLVTGSNALTGGSSYWVYEPLLFPEGSTVTESYSRTVSFEGFRNEGRSVLLTRAWNLLGVNRRQQLPRSSIILSVWRWDADMQDYTRPQVDTATGRYVMEAGEAYFIFVSEPVQLLINPTPEPVEY